MSDALLHRDENAALSPSAIAVALETLADEMAPHGVFVRSWRGLLDTARNGHREFFRVAKTRAPAEDPRIKALDVDDDRESGGDADED